VLKIAQESLKTSWRRNLENGELMSQLPILVVTNPVWLQLFRHGVEDPDWGKRSIDQHSIAKTIFELASMITDAEVKREVQRASSALMLTTAQRIIKETESGTK
jgi:hypothetical protein